MQRNSITLVVLGTHIYICQSYNKQSHHSLWWYNPMSHVNIRLTARPPAVCISAQTEHHAPAMGPLLFLPPCHSELFSLTSFPQVLRCVSEWVLHGGTSLQALFVRSTGAWRSCASSKQAQGYKRPAFFCAQPFFHQVGFYLPVMMMVVISPRLLTFQQKPKWLARIQQVHLVLSKMGPEEKDRQGMWRLT